MRALLGSAEEPNPKDTHALFVRGLAFGFGGAILGLILYSGFSIITGIAIGYVSLAVGWIIAKAIKIGSRGTGGRDTISISAAAACPPTCPCFSPAWALTFGGKPWA